jgi:hypothetical protein
METEIRNDSPRPEGHASPWPRRFPADGSAPAPIPTSGSVPACGRCRLEGHAEPALSPSNLSRPLRFPADGSAPAPIPTSGSVPACGRCRLEGHTEPALSPSNLSRPQFCRARMPSPCGMGWVSRRDAARQKTEGKMRDKP